MPRNSSKAVGPSSNARRSCSDSFPLPVPVPACPCSVTAMEAPFFVTFPDSRDASDPRDGQQGEVLPARIRPRWAPITWFTGRGTVPGVQLVVPAVFDGSFLDAVADVPITHLYGSL